MKKTKMIVLFLMFFLLGCNSKATTIPLTNSYIYHLDAELIPHSTLIKKQNLSDGAISTYQFDNNGYVLSYSLNGLQVAVDYSNKKYFHTIENKTLEYDVFFDNDKNILSMKDLFGKKIATSTFDRQGRIVKVQLTDLGGVPNELVNQIWYENDQVKKTLLEVFLKFSGNDTLYPILLREKQYFYNDKNQLIKTISLSFRPVGDQYVVNEQGEKIPETQEECKYLDHNQQGDWTKFYCELPNKEVTRSGLRTLDY